MIKTFLVVILQNDLKLHKTSGCNLLRALKASEIEASVVAVAALRQDKTHEFFVRVASHAIF